MSKTKGNVVDPLELVRDYGADAFRFSLMAMSGQGRDLRLSLERIEGYRAFCNKLWNASRYVLLRIGTLDNDGDETRQTLENIEMLTGGVSPEKWLLDRGPKLHLVNRWMLARCEESAGKINRALDSFRMAEAAQELYALLWNDYCDWYIELTKELLKDSALALETRVCMAYVLRQIVLLGHPFIPFITEQIFKNAPRLSADELSTLMYGPFPGVAFSKDSAQGKFQDANATGVVDVWRDAINNLRTFRGENGISPKASPAVTYELSGIDANKFELGIPFIASLAHLESLRVEAGNLRGKPDTGEVLCSSAKFFVSLTGLVDVEEEKKRLLKQRETISATISHVEKLLAKPGFVNRAPAALVESEKVRLENLKKDLLSVENSLGRIEKT
jgi:valyl-tRNA synthetase